MKKLVLLIFFCASISAQTPATINLKGATSGTVSIPTIPLADQKTLSDAYKEWQQAQSVADVARLKFNVVMFESMANAKVSPKEYEMTLNNGSFQLVKKEVKNAQTTPTPSVSAKP